MMKKVRRLLFAGILTLAIFLALGTSAYALDYPALYVGNTDVTATAEGTTYWLEDTTATPAAEFTATGASANHYVIAVTYDQDDGYTVTANGADISTYATYIDESSTPLQGGIVCAAPLKLILGSSGLGISETEANTYCIYSGGDLNISGSGDLALSGAFLVTNAPLTCDIDGKLTAANTAGTAPTFNAPVTISAGGNIALGNGSAVVSSLVLSAATLTSENGVISITSYGSSPTVSGNLTASAYGNVNIGNEGGMALAGQADLTSAHGAVTVQGNGHGPVIAGTAAVNAAGDIEIENAGASLALGSTANLTSSAGAVTVTSAGGGPTISGAATINAAGDIEIDNTGTSLALGSTANLTSSAGAVTVTSAGGGPTISGTATISAKKDITIFNSESTGFCCSNGAALTSAEGRVTVTSVGTAPTLCGNVTIAAYGDVVLTGENYMVFNGNSLDVSSKKGAVTIASNHSGAPTVGGNVKVDAYGDIAIANNTGDGFCVSGTTDLTSRQGDIKVSCDCSNPVLSGPVTLLAAGNIKIQNQGSGFCIYNDSNSNPTSITSLSGKITIAAPNANQNNPLICGKIALKAFGDISVTTAAAASCFSDAASLNSLGGNIGVTSAGANVATAALTVRLGTPGKTATFTATSAANPAGFIAAMPSYQVSGGAAADSLTKITLNDAPTYACVQLQTLFTVTASSTNLGSFNDHGDDTYTVTAAQDLSYDNDSVPLSVYFNGLTGANGSDYYLSYGDSASVGWDATKAIGGKGNDTAPSLTVNLIDGEKIVYVYYDPDGPDSDYSGTVLTIAFQIPDNAVYSDGIADYVWDGSAWICPNPFSDVKDGKWYYDDVLFVYANKIMIGTDTHKFSPQGLMVRADLVTMLWRLEGEPAPKQAATFKDVEKGAYYADAVAWAEEEGIVNGYSSTAFGPKDGITREQFATILHRYAAHEHYNTSATADLSGFKDVSSVSAYALAAIKWANGSGLIQGTSATTLSPLTVATRAEAAALLHRFMTTIAVEP